MYAVTVTARGQVVDSASFSSKRKAEFYKAAVRQWAVGRHVMIQVFTERVPALRRAG